MVSAHRAGELLHGFEQRRLRLRRRAVDLVRQKHVGEDGAGHEGPGAVAGGRVFLDDVGSGDVRRHEVRRELYALERESECLRDGAHKQRFRRARHTGDQAMAADKQGDHHLFKHFFLPDNNAPDLLNDGAFDFGEPRDPGFQFGGLNRNGACHGALPHCVNSNSIF